jgi:hypothetical protein
MKKFSHVTLYIVSLCLLFSLQNCVKDTQQNCTTYETDKFLGYYNVSEYCSNSFGHGVSFATINPSNSANTSAIEFYNFLNSGQSVTAYVGCDGSYFRIPSQTLGSSAFTVVGEGYYTNTAGYIQLQFDVQLNENGIANFCSYTYTR